MFEERLDDFGAETAQTVTSFDAAAGNVCREAEARELVARPEKILGFIKTGKVEPYFAHRRSVEIGEEPPPKVFEVLLLAAGGEQKEVYVGEVVPAPEALNRVNRMLKKVFPYLFPLPIMKGLRLGRLKSDIERIIKEDPNANIVWREGHYGGNLPGIVRPEGEIIRVIPQDEDVPPSIAGARYYHTRRANKFERR